MQKEWTEFSSYLIGLNKCPRWKWKGKDLNCRWIHCWVSLTCLTLGIGWLQVKGAFSKDKVFLSGSARYWLGWPTRFWPICICCVVASSFSAWRFHSDLAWWLLRGPSDVHKVLHPPRIRAIHTLTSTETTTTAKRAEPRARTTSSLPAASLILLKILISQAFRLWRTNFLLKKERGRLLILEYVTGVLTAGLPLGLG